MLSNIIHTKWNSSFKRTTKVKRLANAHLIISGKKIHSKPLQKSFLSKKPQYVYPSFTMSSNMLLSSWLTLLRTFRLQRICVMYLDEKYIRRNLPWNVTFRKSARFFVGMTDDQIAEIDPGTGLYPFMVAAPGDTSDLSAVYYLLERNPALVNNSRVEGE